MKAKGFSDKQKLRGVMASKPTRMKLSKGSSSDRRNIPNENLYLKLEAKQIKGEC